MSRSHWIRMTVTVTLTACLGALVWWLLQPPPIERGDRRWCAQIADKPTEAWTADEALGYAQENCMRWHFIEDLDRARDAQNAE